VHAALWHRLALWCRTMGVRWRDLHRCRLVILVSMRVATRGWAPPPFAAQGAPVLTAVVAHQGPGGGVPLAAGERAQGLSESLLVDDVEEGPEVQMVLIPADSR
jgi:hypothetical protein